jgi:hypothetical protein
MAELNLNHLMGRPMLAALDLFPNPKDLSRCKPEPDSIWAFGRWARYRSTAASLALHHSVSVTATDAIRSISTFRGRLCSRRGSRVPKGSRSLLHREPRDRPLAIPRGKQMHPYGNPGRLCEAEDIRKRLMNLHCTSRIASVYGSHLVHV